MAEIQKAPVNWRKVWSSVLVIAGLLFLAELAWLAAYTSDYSNLANHWSKPAPQPSKLRPLTSTPGFMAQPPRPKPTRPAPPPFEFPAGGRRLFPVYRLVALYGTPEYPVLGALGQQPLEQSITRVKDLAKTYQSLTKEHVMPTFEIITTVASATPTDNGDYSNEIPAAKLRPWVKAAKEAGIYVVLDLQSGRTDFLSQAKEYVELLKEPNVGLALDPEWRLTPNQVPLVQIGSVDISEVNQTATWLANLTAQNKLPQKLFLLHQFRLDMINGRPQLDTSHKELAYTIQMDGQGTQPEKTSTWQAIIADSPSNVRFGWKNFYQKDQPMLTPDATMAITPRPWYVSYQ